MSQILALMTRDSLKAYDLEQLRFRGMPIHQVHRPVGYSYFLHRKHGDSAPSRNVRSGASGLLVLTEHTGTHIDAICHQALNHKLHGNVQVTSEVETPYGFTVMGIETVGPIVVRGLLLDVARHKGVDLLPERYRITRMDLQQCCQSEEIEVRKGDAVLVRTGYGKMWSQPDLYNEAAGVSLEATRWLASKGVSLVGADNMGWELDSEIDPQSDVTTPCHALLLIRKGIYIVENLNLEEVASASKHEFTFLCLPLKLVGATGSPVRPVAIAGPMGPSG